MVSVRSSWAPDSSVVVMEAGSTEAAGGRTPSPTSSTLTRGVSGSLLSIRRVPAKCAEDVGEKVTPSWADSVGGMLREGLEGTNAGSVLVTEATNASVPWFSIVNSMALLTPRNTDPKSRVSAGRRYFRVTVWAFAGQNASTKAEFRA